MGNRDREIYQAAKHAYRMAILDICGKERGDIVSIKLIVGSNKGYKVGEKVSILELLRSTKTGGPLGEFSVINTDKVTDVDMIFPSILFHPATVVFNKSELVEWFQTDEWNA